MKARLILTGAFACLLAIPETRAQQIILKTGQRVDTLGLRRTGDTVMGKIQVAGSNGEIGYQVGAIARIAFPEPKNLRPASELLAQSQPEKALAAIEPVIAAAEPFREIPGAWWSQAALVRVSALVALQRDAEAEALAGEIQKNATDADATRAAALQLVPGLLRKQEFEKAGQLCDSAIKDGTRAEVLANAWVKKGDVLAAQKQWDAALLAYLHVPVFYPAQRTQLPTALLGSARAYRRLDDPEKARRTLKELTAAFPKSAEAGLAAAEIEKLK